MNAVTRLDLTHDSLMEELNDDDLLEVNGGCPWWNLSCHLGNKGKLCTVTKECQRNCN
ncbi:MAG TPA: plantaricin C family lantibiotic [Candidatus Dormibacteraeota bacterium]|nr:plantaricin C family lantibiotic [Candidatus Dormibacteraeota bacterium]